MGLILFALAVVGLVVFVVLGAAAYARAERERQARKEFVVLLAEFKREYGALSEEIGRLLLPVVRRVTEKAAAYAAHWEQVFRQRFE